MYIIAYDVVEDKRRYRVHKLLKDFGHRVQYSVFETDITSSELEYVIKKLKTIINLETDSINFYFACQNCEAKKCQIGKSKKVEYLSGYVI